MQKNHRFLGLIALVINYYQKKDIDLRLYSPSMVDILTDLWALKSLNMFRHVQIYICIPYVFRSSRTTTKPIFLPSISR